MVVIEKLVLRIILQELLRRINAEFLGYATFLLKLPSPWNIYFIISNLMLSWLLKIAFILAS